MRIVSPKEMREIEEITYREYHLREELIIENVGSRISDYIDQHYLQNDYYQEIVVLIGKGHNGSDGLAISRHLKKLGHVVRVFLLFGTEDLAKETTRQLTMAKAFGVKVTEVKEHDFIQSYFTQTQNSYLVIDALFGTGVRLPLSNFLFDVIQTVNAHADVIIAIDIPSGVCGATGQIQGNAIKATETLAIGTPKWGHYLAQGPEHIGKLKVMDGGFPYPLIYQGKNRLLTPALVAPMALKRNRFGHKNTFGHLMVMGGSKGMCGANILASKAGLKVGCGLVTAVTFEENFLELASRLDPEIMSGAIPPDEATQNKRISYLENYTAVVMGPGMGQKERTRQVVTKMMSLVNVPLVIDADAINVLNLKKDKELFLSRQAPTILTPHIGEFSRFMDVPKEQLMQNPLEYIQDFVDTTQAALLLKGPSTFMAFPSGEIFVHYLPNSGLAKGGSGDILAGLIGGLFAQFQYDNKNLDRLAEFSKYQEATLLAVVVHSLAGKTSAHELGERSMTSANILDYVSDSFRYMEEMMSPKLEKSFSDMTSVLQEMSEH